jgi:hypothetical protein
VVSGDVGVRNVDGVATMVHERSARVVSAHSESTVGVSVACQSKSTIVDQGAVDEGSEFEVGCEWYVGLFVWLVGWWLLSRYVLDTNSCFLFF